MVKPFFVRVASARIRWLDFGPYRMIGHEASYFVGSPTIPYRLQPRGDSTTIMISTGSSPFFVLLFKAVSSFCQGLCVYIYINIICFLAVVFRKKQIDLYSYSSSICLSFTLVIYIYICVCVSVLLFFSTFLLAFALVYICFYMHVYIHKNILVFALVFNLIFLGAL